MSLLMQGIDKITRVLVAGVVIVIMGLIWGCGSSVSTVATQEISTDVTTTPSTSLISEADPTGFNLDIRFPNPGNLTESQRAIFTDAAARWQQIITGDIPDVPIFQIGGPLSCVAAPINQVVDDLLIDADAPDIDGEGNVLGQAGPCLIRTDGSLPIYGIMQFDRADINRLESEGRLEFVILHEMAHVLGLGTLWDLFELTEGVSNSPIVPPGYDPRYVGPGGVTEYLALGGADVDVPIEDCRNLDLERRLTCGAGTRDGHWKENIFQTELMTGYIMDTPGGRPLSRITAGQFADFGYEVNVAAADPYEIPRFRPIAPTERLIPLQGDILRLPLTLINRKGEVTGVLQRN